MLNADLLMNPGTPQHAATAEDLRLIAHVRLETGSGDKIAEINLDDLFTSMFAEFEPGEVEGLIRNALAARLTSPVRAMVRGHLAKLRAERAHHGERLDRPRKDLAWLDDASEDRRLEEKAVEFRRQRMLEELA